MNYNKILNYVYRDENNILFINDSINEKKLLVLLIVKDDNKWNFYFGGFVIPDLCHKFIDINDINNDIHIVQIKYDLISKLKKFTVDELPIMMSEDKIFAIVYNLKLVKQRFIDKDFFVSIFPDYTNDTTIDTEQDMICKNKSLLSYYANTIKPNKLLLLKYDHNELKICVYIGNNNVLHYGLDNANIYSDELCYPLELLNSNNVEIIKPEILTMVEKIELCNLDIIPNVIHIICSLCNNVKEIEYSLKIPLNIEVAPKITFTDTNIGEIVKHNTKIVEAIEAVKKLELFKIMV